MRTYKTPSPYYGVTLSGDTVHLATDIRPKAHMPGEYVGTALCRSNIQLWWVATGRDWSEPFPYWEPCTRCWPN
jgi:hypothetical protein